MSVETIRTVRNGVSEARAARAEKCFGQWQRFLGVMQLPADASGLVLFLTYLGEEEGLTTRQVSGRLEHIDLARVLRGEEPFRRLRDVREFMRGLAREDPLRAAQPVSEPLYRELVDATIQAVMAPDADQQAAIAAVLLQHHVRCGTAGLIRLRWRDISLRRGSMTVSCPPPDSMSGKVRAVRAVSVQAVNGELCPVAAVGRWRDQGARPNDRVFATLNKSGRGPIRKALLVLRQTGDLRAAIRYASTSALQLRARALLAVGYGAALTSQEARSLTIGDIETASEGLVLTVPGRAYPSVVKRDPGMPGCPVVAWEEWVDVLRARSMGDPERPAFTGFHGFNPVGEPMSQPGINAVVKDAVGKAGLTRGNYSFSSLRWGAIRTAFRADESIHSVASLAAVKSFDGLARHHRREHIVRRSVAGQLGL
ncbi:hypothetical protein DJ010_12740 [Nocardioides silvaticus]|uniref:Tyr recombinase domain-containing protein n=1 Tax=Nocardioides silvaticus TaxID=2201891 RepID=A0A316TSQ1_9ACTN|nr:hypothetical protein [Nocardioides silvaticus]PWN02576.1 hypothetical protein DJ010_12740 [Nocardioides silvaticus]